MIEAKNSKVSRHVRTGIIAGAVVLLLLVLLANCFTVVRPGHTGVVVTLGKVSAAVRSEGLHFKPPFVTNIVQMDNRVLKAEADCAAASRDLQNISSTVAVNYRINADAAPKLFKNVGPDYQTTLVMPAIQESVKAATAQYPVNDLITKRQEVGDRIMELLNEKLEPYGLTVHVLNIIDFEFSEEFNKAIEAKQTAQQQALKAEQDLNRVKIEAEQEVTRAKAEAEALRIKREQLSQEILALEWIQKWDGVLPKVTADGQTLIDISDLVGDKAQ